MPRRVKFFSAIFVLCVLAVAAPAWAAGEKCRKEVWPEAWQYFGDKDAKKLDCDDYVYSLVDLNDDDEEELLVYKRTFACPYGGVCTQEVFGKTGDTVRHLGTLPGRVEVQKTRTDGWLDIVVWTQQRERMIFTWTGSGYKPKPVTKKPVEIKEEKPDDPWSSLP